MHGWALLFSVFGIVFVAELPDKTALAALVLATRHRPLAVWLGAAAALTIQSVVAVAAGYSLSRLPSRPVHVVSGVAFLVSAVLMWRRRGDDAAEGAKLDEGAGFWRSARIVFLVIFVAEWGDLTQIATAALAARTGAPWVVLAGSTLALGSVAAIAVFIGHRAGRFLDPRVTQRVAAVVFAVIGVVMVASGAAHL